MNLDEAADKVLTMMYEDPELSEMAHDMALELWRGSQNEYEMLMQAESERKLLPAEARLYDLYWTCLSEAWMTIVAAAQRKEAPFLKRFEKPPTVTTEVTVTEIVQRVM